MNTIANRSFFGATLNLIKLTLSILLQNLYSRFQNISLQAQQVNTKINNSYLDQEGIKDIQGFDQSLFLLTKQGKVQVMGKDSDYSGCLGLGPEKEAKKFMDLIFPHKIMQIECGHTHIMVRDIKGHLYSWGTGYEGQMGLGQKMVFSNTPILTPIESVEILRCTGNNTLFSRNGIIYMMGYFKERSNFEPIEVWQNQEEGFEIKDFKFKSNLLLIHLVSESDRKLVIVDLKSEHFNEVQIDNEYLDVQIIQKNEILITTYCKTLQNKALYSYELYKLRQNADLEKIMVVEKVQYKLLGVNNGTQGFILVEDDGEQSEIQEEEELLYVETYNDDEEISFSQDRVIETLGSQKKTQQIKQHKSQSLIDNFLMFAQQQKEKKNSNYHLYNPKDRLSNNTYHTPRMSLHSQNIKNLTPITRSRNDIEIMNNSKFSKQSQYSEEDRDMLIENFAKRIEDEHQKLKKSQKLSMDQLQLIEKGNILKLKTFLHVLKSKINYKCSEAFMLMKENDKTKKKQIAAIKYLLTTQAYKEYLLELQSYFNDWKGQYLRRELISAMEHNVDSYAKVQIINVFTKFNQKVEHFVKRDFFKRLIHLLKQSKSLKRCLRTFQKSQLRMSCMIWNVKKRELTNYYTNLNLLFSRLKNMEVKFKIRAFYKIVVDAKLNRITHMESKMNHCNEIIEEEEEQESEYSKGNKPAKPLKTQCTNIVINQPINIFPKPYNPKNSPIKSQRRYYCNTKEDYQSLKYLQRLVLSKPTIQYENPLKLTKKKSYLTEIMKPIKQKQSQSIDFDYEDNELQFLERYQSSNSSNQQLLIQTIQVLNDESQRNSPSKDHRRSSQYTKLNNLSQIARNNNTDIMDEEEQQIINRLIMKYQKETNGPQHTLIGQRNHPSNNSNTTLNFNSCDTLGSLIPTSVNHKKLNSVQLFDRQNLLTERISRKEHFMLIGENLIKDTPREELEEEKLSILSQKSPKSINSIKGRKCSLPLASGHFFHDHKDHSISVSKIEEEIDDEQQYQSRMEFKEFENGDHNESPEQNSGSKRSKRDFSFSIEKNKDGQISQVLSPSMLPHQNEAMSRDKKLKSGNSRNNNYSYSKSKQLREKIALNELTSVLNQQQVQNFQIRQDQRLNSPLGGYTNYQMEQETANFNRGDWQCRSPLQSTLQNVGRPITRNSQNTGDSRVQRRQSGSNYNSESVMGQNFGIGDKNCPSMKVSEEVKSDYIYIGKIHSNNVSPRRTKYIYEDQENNGSPIQEQAYSYYANFSNEFISPDRHQKSLIQANSALRKQTNLNLSNNLDLSSTTTFAQQSAFEQFRSKLNENLNDLNKRRNISIDKGMYSQPNQMQISPKKYLGRKDSLPLPELQIQMHKVQNNQSEGNQELDDTIQEDDNILYQLDTMDIFQRRPVDLLRMEKNKQSVNLEYADPVEMGSNAASINNLQMHMSLRSSSQNINSRPVSGMARDKILMEMNQINEEEPDMTLRQSTQQDQEQHISRIEYEDYDEVSVPILQFDLNQIDGSRLQLKIDRQEMEQEIEAQNNNQQINNFLMNTQQSTQSNGFYKKTMSHNDLVQLGTVQGNYMTQRSFSNQVIPTVDNSKPQMQNKFLDAFKQYEAEKVKRRTEVCRNLNSSFNENQTSSQSLIIPASVPITQFFNQTGPIQFQSLDNDEIGINICHQPEYLEDKKLKVREEIKETEDEEEESFIFTQKCRDPKKNSTIQQIEPMDQIEIGTDRLDLQINTLESNRRKNMSAYNESTMNFGKKQPREITISIDVKKASRKQQQEKIESVKNTVLKDKLVQKLMKKSKPPILRSNNVTPREDKRREALNQRVKDDAKKIAYNEMKKTRSILISHLLGNNTTASSGGALGNSMNSQRSKSKDISLTNQTSRQRSMSKNVKKI